jgi:predicted DsbA family dithiol-disulfide isomerase
MSKAMNTVDIDYYSDVLCIWAWIAERRIEELRRQLGEQINLRYHYVDIFGDSHGKMAKQWQDRGGFSGFAEHVQHSASQFEDAPVHPELWESVRPTTSANAHLFLKAIEIAHNQETSIAMALNLRKAFFIEAKDISQLSLLNDIAKQQQLDSDAINTALNNGTAMALLMSDYQQAKQQGIKGSPSYVMDNGRQTLYGNVGYRVLHANIEELLKKPADEASWC